LFAKLNEWLLPLAGVHTIDSACGVEITKRIKDGVEFTFVINFSTEPQEVTLAGNYEDLLDGTPVSGTFNLQPQGVKVLKGK
jgi:beta-galactosidase GanA